MRPGHLPFITSLDEERLHVLARIELQDLAALLTAWGECGP
jgi:hypothetical protein